MGVTTELQNGGVVPLTTAGNGSDPSAVFQLAVGLPYAADPTLGRFPGLQAFGTAVCTLSSSEAPVMIAAHPGPHRDKRFMA